MKLLSSFLLVLCVVAQPALPLLPSGVTIDMVKMIQVNSGGTVEFVQSTDSSSTIANRMSTPPVIKFDLATGILTVDVAVASGASLLKPGLVAAFLAVVLCAFNSNNKNSAFLVFLFLGLGVASAGMVVADIIIRVPGCFHTEGVGGKILLFDTECLGVNVATFQAPDQPVATVSSHNEWEPINPATSFLPANDHGQHYLDANQQYEIWRATYGRVFAATEKANFLVFTEACRVQNLEPNRDWTAACNQFAHLTYSDWMNLILANNEAHIAAGVAEAGRRRLLSHEEDRYSHIDENHARQLLQTTSFTWVGKGKLTPVKDQGNCGSCYAPSSSSQMEAHLAIVKNTVPIVLSREQLKSCSVNFPGCNGGSPYRMYQYAQGVSGLGTEAAYPYAPTDQACRGNLPPLAYKNSGSISIANNELAFKAALATAPIAVTVCAGTWNNYAGGVFKSCGDSQTCAVNHAVLLVGYGTDATLGPYWLIQNSWNTWWGESGFMRLPRTDSSAQNTGACGLTRYVGYQALTPVSGSLPGATDCQGSWSAFTTCTKTCGGGTQSRTWTTSAQPTNGGAACPVSPQSQTCNTALCGGGTGACLHVANSVLGANGDGDYKKSVDWNQNWCGTATNPQYLMTKNGNQLALFFYATNCYNNVRTQGMWGLGPASIPRAAYQWSDKVTIPASGVVPGPNMATGASWTIQFSTGTTCV
jgi:hypothetical protein